MRGEEGSRNTENTALDVLVPANHEENFLVPEVHNKYQLGILKSAFLTIFFVSVLNSNSNSTSLNSKVLYKQLVSV